MKKLLKKIISALLLLILIGIAVLFFIHREQKKIIERLEDRIEYLTETTIPLRFMLLPSSGGTIKVRVRFYSADEKELSVFEQSFAGDELVIDSVIVPVGENNLAFPSKIFTDAIAPKDGMPLFNFYDNGGVPEIHNFEGLDSDTRQLLKELFEQVMKLESINETIPLNEKLQDIDLIEKSFGNAVHDIKTIQSFETNRVYALVLHTKGGIEIIEE
jgi:hypothetical protein